MTRKERMHRECRTCICEPGFYGTTQCAGCGTEFMRTAANQRFCTPACKKDSNWREYRNRKINSGEWEA